MFDSIEILIGTLIQHENHIVLSEHFSLTHVIFYSTLKINFIIKQQILLLLFFFFFYYYFHLKTKKYFQFKKSRGYEDAVNILFGENNS